MKFFYVPQKTVRGEVVTKLFFEQPTLASDLERKVGGNVGVFEDTMLSDVETAKKFADFKKAIDFLGEDTVAKAVVAAFTPDAKEQDYIDLTDSMVAGAKAAIKEEAEKERLKKLKETKKEAGEKGVK